MIIDEKEVASHHGKAKVFFNKTLYIENPTKIVAQKINLYKIKLCIVS